MSCVSPRAPAGLVAFALKFDSWRIRPRRRAGSTLYFVAAASISAAYGVDAPVMAVAPVVPAGSVVADAAGAPVTDASWAAKPLDPVVPVLAALDAEDVLSGAPAGERP